MKDDAQLIHESLAGDSGAFGQLVRKHQDRLFNTIIHVVGCSEEAEDVVQEAFVLAFVRLATFQHNSSFYTWLYRIAFNTAISRRRRRKSESSVEQSRELTGCEPIDRGDTPTERLERDERIWQVRQALETLTEDHRAILVLREIEGCCYDTISEVLGLPIGTVRSRLHRARLQLREHLKEVLQEHPAE